LLKFLYIFELKQSICKNSSRSLEDYMKLEGIDNSKSSIDVAGVKSGIN